MTRSWFYGGWLLLAGLLAWVLMPECESMRCEWLLPG